MLIKLVIFNIDGIRHERIGLTVMLSSPLINNGSLRFDHEERKERIRKERIKINNSH